MRPPPSNGTAHTRLTRAELVEQAPVIPPKLPDIESTAPPFFGSVGAAMAAKEARIRALELALAEAEALTLRRRGIRAEEDRFLERVAGLLGPGGGR